MRISQLENKDYLGGSGVGEYSYLIINYDTDAAPPNTEEEIDLNPPVTYKVKLNELGKGIIKNLNVVQYGDNRLLKTLNGGETAYSDSTVGYFMDANDKNAIDSAVTAITYDTTNKKFTRAIRNGTAADVVTTAQLLTDMNLNVSDTADSTKYVSSVSESGGKITVARELFSPSLTLTAGTIANAPKIKTTVAGNVSADIELTKASVGTNGVYGVTRLSSAINSSDETVAATPKAVKDAIESLGNVATLDENGRVPASQLPSYVDDVLEGTLATFPSSGETGKIYVDTSTNTSYRWSGSQYTKVASDLSLGETSSTAYRGDYGAAAYTHAITNKGSAFASGLYKITTNSEGHVTAASAVGKADITSLGIPGQDTTYSTGNEFTSGLTKLYTNYGSGTDGAITQNAFTVLMASMITNFGLTVALPYAASITENDTEGILTVALSGLNNNCTTVIQKQDTGDTWTTYTEGDAWEIGDVFRVYVTRTITVGGSTFTNSGVIGSTHTTTTSYTPTSPEEPEENP